MGITLSNDERTFDAHADGGRVGIHRIQELQVLDFWGMTEAGIRCVPIECTTSQGCTRLSLFFDSAEAALQAVHVLADRFREIATAMESEPDEA